MLWLIIILIALAFAIGTFFGAPYVPILRRESEQLLEISGLKPGDRLIDLGSGDGRLLKAAARLGITGIGYEINPIIYLISKVVTWPERRLVTIHLANFWHTKLPDADVIYVFLLDKYMSPLAIKLKTQVPPETLLVSYVFQVPDNKPIRSSRNTYVYKIGELEVKPTKS